MNLARRHFRKRERKYEQKSHRWSGSARMGWPWCGISNDGVGQGGWDGQGVKYLMTYVMFSVFGLRLHSFLSRLFFPADFFQVSFCPVCFFKTLQFSGLNFKRKKRKEHTREYLQNHPKVKRNKYFNFLQPK